MSQMIAHFLVGGVIVSLFAVLGDITHPKGFAGLFAAAPSVAIATLSLTLAAKGTQFAALEARSMIVGEVAFIAYAAGCTYCLGVRRMRAVAASLLLLPLWAAVAGVLYVWILA
jgi:hypothetical protein